MGQVESSKKPRPPALLFDRTIIAPRPKSWLKSSASATLKRREATLTQLGSPLGTLRRLLAGDDLAKVEELPLFSREERHSRATSEVLQPLVVSSTRELAATSAPR